MDACAPTTWRTVKAIAKITLAGVLLACLLWQAQRHDAFTRLVDEPKQWRYLLGGLCCTFTAVVLSFVRWHLLVTALGLDVRLFETLRLGAMGFLLNFVTLGSIGGDLFRAVFLAHKQPGRRTLAVASVVADRTMGLLTQLALASTAIVAANLIDRSSTELATFYRLILAVSVIGWLGVLLVLLVPGLTGEQLSALVETVPAVGKTLTRLIGAVRTYRNNKRMLLAAAALSGVVALFYVSSYYLIARGLPVREPPWSEHLLIVPVSSLAGAIPATPNGLGTLEAAIEVLYQSTPGGQEVLPGDGTMVALTHRLTMVTVALVGLVILLSHRAEAREILHEAEEATEMIDTLPAR